MGSSLSRTGKQIFFPFPDIELHWGRGVEFVYRDNFSLYILEFPNIKEGVSEQVFCSVQLKERRILYHRHHS